jgi:hypothetical protein
MRVRQLRPIITSWLGGEESFLSLKERNLDHPPLLVRISFLMLACRHDAVSAANAGDLGEHQELWSNGRRWPAARWRAQSRPGFPGKKLSSEPPASITKADARLYKKGRSKGVILCFMGHELIENRNGLVVKATATLTSEHAERLAAREIISPLADREACHAGLLQEFRHASLRRLTAQDQRYAAYRADYQLQALGCAKTVVSQRALRHREAPKVDWQFTFAMAA